MPVEGIRPVSYTHLDVYKRQEEYTDVERPQTFTSLTITGSAVEEGEVPMHMISPTDKVSNKFEAFLSLQSGKFSFKGVTSEGVSTDIGKGHEPGVVAMNSYGISAEVTGPVYICLLYTSRCV